MPDKKYSWPPTRIPWENGWEQYCEKIFLAYKEAFNHNQPFFFDGIPVRTRKRPVANEKDGGFWHIIGGSDGVPDKDRCECVVWARVLIENYTNDNVLVWEEPSHHDGEASDVVFWAKDLDYYAILAKRNGYWLLRSAYCVVYESKKRKLEKAFRKFGPYKTGIAN